MNPGINTVVDYLSSVPAWYLATCEGDQPHVRPFSFVAGFDDRIWFCTGKQKDVFRELEKNPLLEVSAWKPGSGWLVLRGEADLTDEVNDIIRRAGFAHMRSLGEVYDGVEDENLTFFSVKNPRAWIRDIDDTETELVFADVPPAWTMNEDGEFVENVVETESVPAPSAEIEAASDENPPAAVEVEAPAETEGVPAPDESTFAGNVIPPDESTFVGADIPPDESTFAGAAIPPDESTFAGTDIPPDESTLVIEQPLDNLMQAPQAFYTETPQEASE